MRYILIVAPQRERLDGATPEQLRELASRVLTVRGLDDLFEG